MFLDFVAPWSIAELRIMDIESGFKLDEFAKLLASESRLIKKQYGTYEFRIDGDFFPSNIKKAIEGIATGGDTESFNGIGFNLILSKDNNSVIKLVAKERVIFGWFEKKGVSISLGARLEALAQVIREASGKFPIFRIHFVKHHSPI